MLLHKEWTSDESFGIQLVILNFISSFAENCKSVRVIGYVMKNPFGSIKAKAGMIYIFSFLADNNDLQSAQKFLKCHILTTFTLVTIV